MYTDPLHFIFFIILGKFDKILYFNTFAWKYGWETALKLCLLLMDVVIVAQCKNMKGNCVSLQWFWVFQINILTVVFMKASPRESDPMKRRCPAGGILWDRKWDLKEKIETGAAQRSVDGISNVCYGPLWSASDRKVTLFFPKVSRISNAVVHKG